MQGRDVSPGCLVSATAISNGSEMIDGLKIRRVRLQGAQELLFGRPVVLQPDMAQARIGERPGRTLIVGIPGRRVQEFEPCLLYTSFSLE